MRCWSRPSSSRARTSGWTCWRAVFGPGAIGELADFYDALAGAEERHAEIFVDLARPLVPEEAFARRLDEVAVREAEILAALPHEARIH